MSDVIYRRRYICPNCGHHGRHSNKVRSCPILVCPVCREAMYLQEQREDAVYEKPCVSVNACEWMI